MTKRPDRSRAPHPVRVRLPGFLVVQDREPDQEIGLGDAIGRVTSRVGIRPCDACKSRAAWLNRRIVFTRRG